MRVRSNGFACSEGAHDEEGRATNQAEIGLLRRLIVGLPWRWRHRPGRCARAVSLQLKWKHQFQFAGYYQALAQVSTATPVLTSPSAKADLASTSPKLLPRKADFGVCTASVLRDWQWAAGWSCWPPFSSVPRLSSWSPAAPTSAACRICAAVR